MNALPLCRLLRSVSLSARANSAAAGRYAVRGLILALLSSLPVTSCSDRLVQPGHPPKLLAELQIRASVAGTSVNTLVITVSAPDIDPALVFNIEAVSGVATGTIALPIGAGRMVVVRAFDGSGTATHEGSKQIDVRPGSNPTVSITLTPLLGSQPIDVRLGNFLIHVTPGTALIGTQQVVALSAAVTDLDGKPVTVDPAAIRWASFDSRIATVDTRGWVTGQSVGDVQIVASFGGAAGAARVTIGPALLAAGDVGVCSKSDDEATAALLDTLDGLVLALGDLAYEDGTTAEFTNCYHTSWGRHKARTRPAAGNHDYHTTLGAGYFAYFDEVLAPFGPTARDGTAGYYSYDVGSWHIVVLNSADAVVPFNATSAQIAWLKADLAATTAKCVLAYWHHPRFSSGNKHGSSSRPRAAWDELYAANADVVLVAHEHIYERFAPQTPAGLADPVRGIRQFLVGTGGAGLYGFVSPRLANSEFGWVQHGILELVLGAETYSWRFITARDGLVRDSGTGSCH